MTARKLRDIFVSKYLPLLDGVEIKERNWQKWWQGEKFETYILEFKPYPKSVSVWAVEFGDYEGGKVLMRVSGIGEKVFRGDMTEEDWKIFYRLLNRLVSKVVAGAVAHLVGGAAFDRTISFPPKAGREYTVYFSLSKVSVSSSEKELVNFRPYSGFITKLAKAIQLNNI